MTTAYQRFEYAFFHDPTSARDALDVAALLALEGDDRTRAETALIAFLPDARAVIGLGALRSKRAEPELRRLFDIERARQLQARRDGRMQPGGPAAWYPSALLYLARALWLVSPDPTWPRAALEVLASADDWVFRQQAIEALAGVDQPEVAAALTRALDDGDTVVRHAAGRALLSLFGLPVPVERMPDMRVRLLSDDPARRDTGKRDILAAVAGRAMVRQ